MFKKLHLTPPPLPCALVYLLILEPPLQIIIAQSLMFNYKSSFNYHISLQSKRMAYNKFLEKLST